MTQRRSYSVLTLQRLMFIQQIQQKGWLAGDTWYLQMRFEAALQKGKSTVQLSVVPDDSAPLLGPSGFNKPKIAPGDLAFTYKSEFKPSK